MINTSTRYFCLMKPALFLRPAARASYASSKRLAEAYALIRLLSIFMLGLVGFSAQGQTAKDSTREIVKLQCFPQHLNYPYSWAKVRAVALTNVVGYSGAMIGLYSAWYKDYPQTNMHAFNDFDEWKQIDKIGHAYSAYAESKASMELWRWTGISRKKQIWLGGLSGAFYQTVIETLDGFSAEWGWSWGDFGANVIGSGMLIAQELAWDEQHIQFKFSFHRKRYDNAELNLRSDKIFGSSTAERFLKDYNGQTYWLSTAPAAWIPHCRLPAWFQLSIGTGAEGLFGARNNIGKDENGLITFNHPEIKRVRQWYLAPDIDLSKIRTRKKGIRTALNLINIVKFPAPGLELTNGKLKWRWLIF